MPGRSSVILLLFAVPLWLAAAYGVRLMLMEDGQWVAICAEQVSRWECEARAGLGLLIHFKVIASVALGAALLAFIVPARAGWWLAALALFLGLAGLALYTASFAALAVVIAGLRLVRQRSTSS
ncbi:hypothetical protein D3C76_615020 [compost metagenome]